MNRTPRQYCERHGIDYRLYSAWVGMRKRCRNKNGKDYKDYGGRGITVCERWNDFISFAADMEPHPGKGWSLDRRDNNGNYCKSNCRWATASMQVRNQRRSKLSEEAVVRIRKQYATGLISYSVLATQYGVCKASIADVVKNRWWR